MHKLAILLCCVAGAALGRSGENRLFDWMVAAGGYQFENEAGKKRYGMEISFLPETYFGFVANMDLEGRSYTRNLGVELLGNALAHHWIMRSGMEDRMQSPFSKLLVFLPGIELGGSLSARDEVGLHTSVFLNFVVFHPYMDYNLYGERTEKKFGVKWKLGFGPWFIKAMEQ